MLCDSRLVESIDPAFWTMLLMMILNNILNLCGPKLIFIIYFILLTLNNFKSFTRATNKFSSHTWLRAKNISLDL